jgi:hypothetical protein
MTYHPLRPLAGGLPSGACPLPASGRRHPADHRGACSGRGACGDRRHSCHICGCQRCGGDRCGAFGAGGPGAGWAGAGAVRGRGGRRGCCHVALSQVPAAGRVGGRRRAGGRGAERGRLSGGRGASACPGGWDRLVAVAYRRVAGRPCASCCCRGLCGRGRAVADPPVAAHRLDHAVAGRRGPADHRDCLAGTSGTGIRRGCHRRRRRARLVRGAGPAHRRGGDCGGAGLGGPAGCPRQPSPCRGEGVAAVHRGRRGRRAVVHQSPRVRSAGRGPVVPRIPVLAAARRRRYPPRCVAYPSRRASGAGGGNGRAGGGDGARGPAGGQESRIRSASCRAPRRSPAAVAHSAAM